MFRLEELCFVPQVVLRERGVAAQGCPQEIHRAVAASVIAIKKL